MIPYNDLVYINKKLSLMIWINLIAIVTLVTSLTLVIYFETYWLLILIGLLAIVHFICFFPYSCEIAETFKKILKYW